MNDIQEEIQESRDTIDKIDQVIMALIAERYKLADSINLMKEYEGEDVRDFEREDDVLDHVASVAEERGVNPKAARRIYRQVVMSCADRQKNQRSE
ncbi:chorismate mutase [Salinibacter ruber]|uniref:chorismate mutase n=1 Tax=Salinibacter ruber TaxID=146919 RepID=A0A9X2QFP6_9BACT|nr:chorismate mutase [Salinibacter ruber]MCS3661818.1 chorismate mutase [Salinibacter ruber]MCS3711633.1 chorismate mutase [Salinibacter ruber]